MPEQCRWGSGVIIANFEYNLVFLLLTVNRSMLARVTNTQKLIELCLSISSFLYSDQMLSFAWFGTFGTILKNVKNTHGWVLF